MFTQEDEDLLAQALPERRKVSLQAPVYAGGVGILEYREAGEPDRPAILLMHGIGSSSAGYRAQLAGLQDRYRLIAWNAPGFGQSTALADPRPDVCDYVSVARALLESLGIPRLAGVVGSSWGSVVATAFARIADTAPTALILAAPNLGRGKANSPEEREAARSTAIDAGLASFHQDRHAIATRLLSSDAAPAVWAHAMRLRDEVTLQGWSQAMNMLFTTHTPDLLPGVAAPVTLVVGDQDRVAPAEVHAAALKAVRPDAKCIGLPGVGHLPKLEAPMALNCIIEDQLRHFPGC